MGLGPSYEGRGRGRGLFHGRISVVLIRRGSDTSGLPCPSARAPQESSPCTVHSHVTFRHKGDVRTSRFNFFFLFSVFFFCVWRTCRCMHSVAQITVSVPDEPAHVEAEGQEAGPQQVAQGRQVRDGEVVGVHASTPHPVNHPVGQVEEDHHLQ